MLTLRYMRLTDIQQVVKIDSLSFDPPWSAQSYAYETSESTYSHMLVLAQDAPADDEPSADKNGNVLRRLMQSINGTPNPPPLDHGQIIGYGGLWNIIDEAHISTIATHPDARGQGWGEIMLAAMIRKSFILDAGYIVLEVRVSNTAAQNLYRKYEFVTSGVKTGYYRNNNEDAFDMRLDLNAVYREQFEARYAELLARNIFIDDYSSTQHPQTHL